MVDGGWRVVSGEWMARRVTGKARERKVLLS